MARIFAIECALPIASEGPEPDVLAGIVEELVPVIAPPALSGSDVDPAVGPVDGAGVAGPFDERFDEHGCGGNRSVQSAGRRRRTMARMCEPRFGISTHGRMRKRGLSTTSGSFFSRSSGVQPMKLSRGARFHAAVEKPSMASGQPFRLGHQYEASF